MPSQAGVNRWTPSLIGARANAVAVDAIDPAIAYAATAAGVFKTMDRGLQWTLVDPNHGATAIAIDPRDHSSVISGSTLYLEPVDGRGVSKTTLRLSDDGGSTWTELDAGDLYGPVMTLAFDPNRPGTIYAALLENGIAKSADRGKTWTFANRGLQCCWPGSEYFYTQDVATGGFGSSTIYMALISLFSSADGAENWNTVTLPGERFEPYRISIDRADPARLYVTGWFMPGPDQSHAIGPGVFTSGDGGRNWLEFSVRTISRITIDPRVPTTLYTTSPFEFGHPARGALRSTDRGVTWTEFNAGLTALDATAIDVDPSGTLLYASTPAGVFVHQIVVPPRRRAVSK